MVHPRTLRSMQSPQYCNCAPVTLASAHWHEQLPLLLTVQQQGLLPAGANSSGKDPKAGYHI